MGHRRAGNAIGGTWTGQTGQPSPIGQPVPPTASADRSRQRLPERSRPAVPPSSPPTASGNVPGDVPTASPSASPERSRIPPPTASGQPVRASAASGRERGRRAGGREGGTAANVPGPSIPGQRFPIDSADGPALPPLSAHAGRLAWGLARASPGGIGPAPCIREGKGKGKGSGDGIRASVPHRPARPHPIRRPLPATVPRPKLKKPGF